MKATRWTAILALTILATGGLAILAQESEEPAKPESEIARAARKNREAQAKQEEPAAVFTNDDIERIASGGSSGDGKKTSGGSSAKTGSKPLPKTAPGAKRPAQDPMEWLEERKEQEADKKRQIQQAEAKIAELRQKVDDLQKRRLAITNPFLARPKTPDDPEEADQWENESVAERRDTTEQALDQARSDLLAAESNLRRLRSQ